MEDQLLRRINGLEAELAALREMMVVLENGRPKAKPNASRTYRREISRRTVLGLIVIATFLLLDGNLQ